MIEQFSDVKVVAEGFSFLEGPRWYKGRLYVSDFYTQRVLAFDEAGGMELICTVPNDPSGLGFMPDGTLLIVSMRDRRLLRLTDAGLEEVADLSGYTPFLTNDMLVDPAGRASFRDPPMLNHITGSEDAPVIVAHDMITLS